MTPQPPAAPRQALELLANWLDVMEAREQLAADPSLTSAEWSDLGHKANTLYTELRRLDRAVLRAQAEADRKGVQVELQEHFSTIRGVLRGERYVPQHLRALLDSPYNAQRERDAADGLAQTGGES